MPISIKHGIMHKGKEGGTLALTWAVFDIIGTIAFALSGAIVGLSKKMDIFGVIVLSVLTAVGGGIIRDILVGVIPPSALMNTTNLLLAVATAIIVSVVYGSFQIAPEHKTRFLFVYYFSDTLGLAAFTITGVIMGLAQKDAFFTLPVLLGLLTAVGGGVLRDLLAQQMPTVLYADVYAVAAVAGAFVVCVAAKYHADMQIASWLGFLTVAVLRFLALRYHWQIYHPRPVKKNIKPQS